MKKLLVCVGLAAIGTSSLRAQFNPGLTSEEMSKPWSVAAELRGFYDDNYLTVPNGQGKRHTYGVEVSPQASFNHDVYQTAINANVVYDLKYDTDRHITEQQVVFNTTATHTFSEAYSMNASETFIYSQEPTVLAPDTFTATPLRTSQNNIHNDASIGGSAELTKTLSLKASYQNNLFAYEQLEDDAPQTTPRTPSYSALLDRIDQTGSIEADWKALNDLDALLGYQYENVDYTSPEAIIYGPAPVSSKSRNNESHFFFAGVDYQFNSQLTASVRAGGQYIEYDNAPTHVDDTSPYVDASLTWNYMQDSSLQVGVKHQHYATDVVGGVNSQGNPVLDSEATAVYASLNQTIMGGLTAGLLGQWQHSEFNGGTLDGQSEDFYVLGVNLAYRFNPYLSADTGYTWNKLTSDVSGRDYTRNQVFIGVKGEY